MRRRDTARHERTTAELDAVAINQLIAEEHEPRPTQLMPRAELLGLIDATIEPDPPLHAHTVPRGKLENRKPRVRRGVELDTDLGPSVSPVAVFLVIVVLVGLFIAVVQLH